jgi:hypothetical protein
MSVTTENEESTIMTETYSCPGPWPWQWFRTCTRDVPARSGPCDAATCIDAKARVADARGRFQAICNGLRTLNALSKLLKQILATPVWIILALALIAAIIGGPIGAVIWALIALYGLSWFLVFIVGKMAQNLATSLIEAQTDLTNALKDVVANCPESCRGDISIPNCNVD